MIHEPRPVFHEAREMVMGVLAEKERLVRSPLSHFFAFSIPCCFRCDVLQ
jgi:hypothetical protein